MKRIIAVVLALTVALSISAHRVWAATALELELVGAGPDGTPIRIDADSGGSAVVWLPYRRATTKIGMLVFAQAEGKVTLSGNRVTGSVEATIPGDPMDPQRKITEVDVEVTVNGQAKDGVIGGKWIGGGKSGPLHGFARKIPPTVEIKAGCVTLDRAYPSPGREGQFGYGSAQARLGGSFEISSGKVIRGTTSPNRARASWYSGESFRPTMWHLPGGESVVICGGGYDHESGSVSGSLSGDRLKLQLKATIEHQSKPAVWDVQLRRAGTLWYGTWKWKVAKGIDGLTGIAAGRLKTSDASFGSLPDNSTKPHDILLRHALKLADHPAGAIWRDDLLASAVAGTGNKQYDNPPNNVAGGILTGLLIYRLSDDPLIRAEGLAMARRTAYWWNLARTGPLRISGYYKGMFYTTAWAGLGLAELSKIDPNGPWKTWSIELTETLKEVQLSSGAWTWVDEETGKIGTSNDRNDRSRDNRHLNCGDLLLAMSRLARESGANAADAERQGDAYLRRTMAKPPGWFYQGRQPDDMPEPLGTVCYLQWLVERARSDSKQITIVRSIIEKEFKDLETGLLRGFAPRWGSGGSALDLSASARYAHCLTRLGDREKAYCITKTILDLAAPETGLIDYLGRQLPADPNQLGRVDSHPYLCMKAAIGWELLGAIEADRNLLSLLSRASQTIDFTPIENKQTDDTPFTISVKSDSGLPITLKLLEGPARLEGNRVTLSGEVGVVQIEATQPGNSKFLPAATVQVAFPVGDARPAAPGELAALSLAIDTIRLTWKNEADDAFGFRIEQSDDGRTWHAIAEVEPSHTTFDVKGLKQGQTAKFRIFTFNRVLDSAPTDPIEIHTHAKSTVIELELERGIVGSDWKIVADPTASGGKYVEAGVTHRESGPPEGKKSLVISLPFKIDLPGRYTIHYRVYGTSGSNDSQFLRVDDRPWSAFYSGNQSRWQWESTDIEFDRSGNHILQFGCREATGRIDRVVITNGEELPKD